MVGITLSPEQIRRALADVRRWLEQEIATTLGFHGAAIAPGMPSRQLASCTVEEARAILMMIQNLLPVVDVFFELGREPAAYAGEGLHALRLDEILRHTRLRDPQQVIACLGLIDQAMQRVRGEPDAAVTAVDQAGHCLVADSTARSIVALWQEVVAAHDLVQPDGKPAPDALHATMPTFQVPYPAPTPGLAVPGQPDNRPI